MDTMPLIMVSTVCFIVIIDNLDRAAPSYTWQGNTNLLSDLWLCLGDLIMATPLNFPG